ncbi:uncharacterized protein K460DRAFT_308071 [Cucurbitaria berberidis CBS 394.84]|uniref:Uncharacterized protein n=1 Tax=Cucurbitaria berberidis CBS 394.84 TaxID=1168544 RepID=A0A9P4GM21_9PLEO|nr:uncharacterized protein K460DRAFT_308071 [Cucurbitaria berberidis CBS 394.84]KAF1848132.1 hypothetical protein K460DRAFT_308071 [Cucurbitaria berberidis CBS 394.84]
MATLIFILLALCFSEAFALVLTTPPPAHTTLARRDNAAAIPTFTFGPQAQYFPKRVANPEPSGTSLHVYPTGSYNEFPKEGITIGFGPDLRKQIKETMIQNCKDKPRQDCRNSVIPILQNTDVTTHTKRFVVISAILLSNLLVAIAAEAFIIFGEGVYLHNTANDLPKEMIINHGDLKQINFMAGAHTFAAVTAATAVPSTVTYNPPATTTASDAITIETLTADKDGRKAGDIVYHIPQHASERIQDFLGMTGLRQTQEKCKGQNLKRADNLADCLRLIQRHGMDLADSGPSNLLQLAPRHIPARPGQGQAIGFPVQNLATNGALLVIPVYHVVFDRAPRAPNADQGWDPAILAKSAMAVTLAAHAAMFVGQGMLEIWVPKSNLEENLREEDLVCPKDLICVMDDCKGQEEREFFLGKEIKPNIPMTPICTVAKNYGCRCTVVNYPHVTEVPFNYMEEQYKWLEELIKRSELPSFEPQCSEGMQTLQDASKKLKDVIELACNEHPELKDTWTYSDSKDGFTFGINFQKRGGDCAFDCRAIFPTFADSDSCITSSGLQKNGKIETDCGSASYLAYNLS